MPAKTDSTVALVTGAAMGIGAATAERLARDGMTVLVSDIKLDEAEKTAQGFRQMGLSAEAIQLDVAQVSSIDAAFEHIKQRDAELDRAVESCDRFHLGLFAIGAAHAHSSEADSGTVEFSEAPRFHLDRVLHRLHLAPETKEPVQEAASLPGPLAPSIAPFRSKLRGPACLEGVQWTNARPLPSEQWRRSVRLTSLRRDALAEFMHIGCAVSHVVATGRLAEAGCDNSSEGSGRIHQITREAVGRCCRPQDQREL